VFFAFPELNVEPSPKGFENMQEDVLDGNKALVA